MSRREPAIALRQMRDHASEAIALVRGKTEDEVAADRVLTLALARLLEVVGGAATRVPAEERARHGDIPWSQVIGLRNRLIHGYDTVNFRIVWQIIRTDLPPLVSSLERILREQPHA